MLGGMVLHFLVLASAFTVFGQDGSGRSGTAKRTDGSSKVWSGNSGNRLFRRSRASDSKPEVTETGRVAIMINEGGSKLELIRKETNEAVDIINVPQTATSLIIRTVPVGTYTLTARKDGYFEETRTVEIEKGKRERVDLLLRPKMAILSVSSNLADAEIDIDGVGSFTGGIERAFVTPGTYKITAKRRGYLSRQASVTLESPGREEFLRLILEPLRIDAVLDLANENLVKGNLTEATELTNDVLLLNPSHARANLIFGLIRYDYGDTDSIPYFQKAIKNGETVRFPVKILVGPMSRKLAEAEISIDRDGINIASKQQPELNFTIKRTDLIQLTKVEVDGKLVSAALNGKSDFYGRPIEPRLQIYSANAALGDDSQSVCTVSSSGRTCYSDIEIIVQLLSAWRADPEIVG